MSALQKGGAADKWKFCYSGGQQEWIWANTQANSCKALRWDGEQAGDLLKEQILTADYRQVQKAGPIVGGNTESELLTK